MKRIAGALLLLTGGMSSRPSDDFEPLLIAHRESDPARAGASRAALDASLQAKSEWTVRDCIDLAWLHHEAPQFAGESLRQAIFERDRAVAAALPTITARVTHLRQEATSSSTGVPLRVKAPLFAGFREHYAVAAGDEFIAAERANVLQEKSLLGAATASAFYQVLKLDKALATQERTLAVQKERREGMVARVNAGVARQTELLLVESQLAGQETAVIRTRNEFAITRERLGLLIGTPLTKALRDDAPDPAVQPLDALLQTAMASRPDLVALDALRRAAEKQVDVESAAWYPALNLTGNLFLYREGALEDVGWDLLVEAEWNLWEGGGSRARVAAARSLLRQAELSLALRKREVAIQVREELLSQQSLEQEERSLRKKVEFAEENHKLLTAEFAARVATNLEVQIALNDLNAAQLELEAARYDRKAAGFRILFVTGQLK